MYKLVVTLIQVMTVNSMLNKNQSIKSGDSSVNLQAQRDIIYVEAVPRELVDEKVSKELLVLRRSRFFIEFNQIKEAKKLSVNVSSGDYSSCSDSIKCESLAWCARLLSRSDDNAEIAQECLSLAEDIQELNEVKIAKAFMHSQKEEKKEALQLLSGIDSPQSRSAAFMIMTHHEGSENSIDWLAKAGYQIGDLDADGKLFYLFQLIDRNQWNDSLLAEGCLKDEDFEEAPVLYHVSAIIHMVQAVPNELRPTVCYQLPFEVASFPLASDSTSMEHRKDAQSLFSLAADMATKLDSPIAAAINRDYALWLELSNADTFNAGREKLVAKLHDIKSSLRLVHFGLQFGVQLDLDAVRQELDRQVALNGGATHETALVRFSLAFKERTPANMAQYIERHFEELQEFIAPNSMRFIQIEMLAKAEATDEASKKLEDFKSEDLFSEDELLKLSRIISETTGHDLVEIRKKDFEGSNSLGDIFALVEELEAQNRWDELVDFSRLLFERTHNIRDVERYIRSLNNSKQYHEVVKFIRNNEDYLSQSSHLQLCHCWALFYEGEMLASKERLSGIAIESRTENYRALEVNIGIALGDWGMLSEIVAREYREREKRTAHELLQTAKLAIHISSPQAKDLLYSAARKAKDDAEIMAASYFIAVRAGWEGDQEVAEWLQIAAQLSGADGPIQKMSLENIVDQKPDWDKREAETWRLLGCGEVPIFIAAQSLRRSTIELSLFPALSNLSETNLIRKALVPAFCGNRPSVSMEISNIKVGVDATALITLSFLDVLEETLNSFDTVYVPHTLLFWLFEEKARAVFHQPSRIHDAHKIRDLLARGSVEKLNANVVVDSELSISIGDELASMLTEAKRFSEDFGVQCLVVRPAPVYVVSSFMKEKTELNEYSSFLSSCQSVIDKLRDKGVITGEEEKKAKAYLKLQEIPWPNQPGIDDGATLILEDLAISYFLHVGLLGKLKDAGFRVIVSSREVSEVNALISYEGISEQVLSVVEKIRAFVSSGIESGKVKVGRKYAIDREVLDELREDPTIGAISLAEFCDFIITDDRFLNQHSNIGESGAQAKVVTSLDVLSRMVHSTIMTSDRLLELKTKLRRGGYCFVPVDEEEIFQLVSSATINSGIINETAELKAIADNALRVRMSDWLQLPKEALWLETLFKSLARVIKLFWVENEDSTDVIPRVNWILDLLDVRGWAHRIQFQDMALIKFIRGPQINLLLHSPEELSDEKRKEYWGWLEEVLIEPIRSNDPDLYKWLVDQAEGQIKYAIDSVDKDAALEEDLGFPASLLAGKLLNANTHPSIRSSLLERKKFREALELEARVTISFNEAGVSFFRSDLFKEIRKVLNNEMPDDITDHDGNVWGLKGKSGDDDLIQIEVFDQTRSFLLPDFSVFYPESEIRLRRLNEKTKEVNLPKSSFEHWYMILSERPLSDDEIDAFDRDFLDTPVSFSKLMCREIEARKKEGKISDLVPSSRRYYDRLVGEYDGSMLPGEYVQSTLKNLIAELSDWNHYEGFLLSLLLTSHSSFSDLIEVESLDRADLLRAYNYIVDSGDSLSQIGAIDVGLRILPDYPELEEILVRLISKVRDDNVDDENSNVRNLSALFILVDGELSRLGIMSDVAPFYRRLASLTHAGLMYRQLKKYGAENTFYKWAVENRSTQFYWQTLCDMRLEPRWTPDMVDPYQVKQDLFGRILIAGNRFRDSIKKTSIDSVIFDESGESIIGGCDLVLPYYPSPLEGGGEHPNSPPDGMSLAIEHQLDEEVVSPASFFALVNSAKIFRLENESIDKVSKVLRAGKYQLQNIENDQVLLAMMVGLAYVAAVNKNTELAGELRILTRVHRRQGERPISTYDSMRFCFLVAASYRDTEEWASFIGDWLFELVHEDLKIDEIKMIYAHLQVLLNISPELWVSCAKAEAVIKSLIGR
jgi:hypothetical protein